MENAIDALHIGASVLIFVLALSISIGAFGQARQTTQMILNYRDREYELQEQDYITNEIDGEGKLITTRVVGAEMIIPSIYKAYQENYKIVFKDSNNQPIEIYQVVINSITPTPTTKPIYAIDLENETSLGSAEDKEKFIRALLYGR